MPNRHKNSHGISETDFLISASSCLQRWTLCKQQMYQPSLQVMTVGSLIPSGEPSSPREVTRTSSPPCCDDDRPSRLEILCAAATM